MACTRGCCASPKEHYRSLSTRTGEPRTKVTVEDTPDTVNTVTEHWQDRQDVSIRVKRPMTLKET